MTGRRDLRDPIGPAYTEQRARVKERAWQWDVTATAMLEMDVLAEENIDNGRNDRLVPE